MTELDELKMNQITAKFEVDCLGRIDEIKDQKCKDTVLELFGYFTGYVMELLDYHGINVKEMIYEDTNKKIDVEIKDIQKAIDEIGQHTLDSQYHQGYRDGLRKVKGMLK